MNYSARLPIQLQVHWGADIPHIAGEGDEFPMDVFRQLVKNYGSNIVAQLNACRMYLEVQRVSDINDARGTRIGKENLWLELIVAILIQFAMAPIPAILIQFAMAPTGVFRVHPCGSMETSPHAYTFGRWKRTTLRTLLCRWFFNEIDADEW